MSNNTIHCPECGSTDVECIEKPHHNHICHGCGHTLLPRLEISGEGTEAPCVPPRATDAEHGSAPLPGPTCPECDALLDPDVAHVQHHCEGGWCDCEEMCADCCTDPDCPLRQPQETNDG